VVVLGTRGEARGAKRVCKKLRSFGRGNLCLTKRGGADQKLETNPLCAAQNVEKKRGENQSFPVGVSR